MGHKKERNCLFGIIKYSLVGGEFPCTEEIQDWDYLYKLSKHHKLEEVVYYGLKKMPRKMQPPQEILQKLCMAWKVGLAREATQQVALEEILDAFETAGIDCIPLKGSVLKQFYPSPELRMMSDLDILYRSEQKKEVETMMMSKGYEKGPEINYHEEYFRRPFMNVEMHHTLFSEEESFADYFESIWERAKIVDGKNHLYYIEWEEFYVFMLAHVAKHFRDGGTGIRSIIDVWQFINKMKDRLDWNYLEEKLEKAHLKTFNNHIRMLADIWFGNEKSTEFYDDLTDYIVNSGVYGTQDNKKTSCMVKKNKVGYGCFRTWIDVIFLPVQDMKYGYPYLEKYPLLLPVAWMHRILRNSFRKRDRAIIVLHKATECQKGTIRVQNFFNTLDI